MDDCIFCKISQGEIPSTKIYEDSNYLAFLDIMPATKGHALVIPKKHYPTFLDIPENELSEFIKIVQKVASAVVKATQAQGYKIEMFNNEISGQTIFHAHFHIIPRSENDEIKFNQGKGWWIPQKDLYSENEMQELAEKIRESF